MRGPSCDNSGQSKRRYEKVRPITLPRPGLKQELI
jgi:hypothetical protein